MAKYGILKAVEHSKTSAEFRKQYHTLASLEAAGWWLQRKYDGCFGMAVIRAAGASQMLSRTFVDYTPSCGHILHELREAATAQLDSWDAFVVLGEVWHPKLSFPTISGKFRKNAPSDLQFIANDLLPTELVTNAPYEERFESLQLLLPELTGASCCTSVAMTLGSKQWTDAEQHARTLVAQGGYDGAILRDPRAPYTIEEAKAGQIIKVKPTLSLDLRVVGHAIEPGAKTGRAVVTLAVEYRGVQSWVGSGVPHTLGPANAAAVVGRIVEVEALGITADGKLREPRFKGIRHDKLEPDT